MTASVEPCPAVQIWEAGLLRAAGQRLLEGTPIAAQVTVELAPGAEELLADGHPRLEVGDAKRDLVRKFQLLAYELENGREDK